MLWLPPATGEPPPVVLLGHGGSGHKASERIAGLGTWFAAHAGLAAVAIDGPYHGDRVTRPMTAAEYQPLIAAEGVESVLDRMTADWLTTLDSLGAKGLVDAANVGYVGLSMGTRFGLPVAAALGDRLRCAVLGKFGLEQSPAMHPGLHAPQRVAADARQITAPVLFHVQWDDEIFPVDGQLALFNQLASGHKWLAGFPGGHAETSTEAIDLWRDFIRRHLSRSRNLPGNPPAPDGSDAELPGKFPDLEGSG